MNAAIAEEKIQQAVAGLKGISHETRLGILCHLAQAPHSVNQLVELTGASQSSVSQHLAKMQYAGWVDFQRKGTLKEYRLANSSTRKLLEALHEIYCQ